METGGGGTQQEHTGGQPGRGDERGAGHGGHEDERSDGQRPADRTVPGDMHEVVEPQQQRSDGDGDGRQDPVAVAGGDDDDRKHERGDQLDEVAMVTDRSMRFASGLVGLRPVPAVTRMPYTKTATTTTRATPVRAVPVPRRRC